MQIVVCVKQVPDTTQVKVDPNTGTLIREGVPFIINPFDTHAVEESLRLKDKYGLKVTAISMGPPTADETLRKALALGIDEVVLLSDRAFAGADTWATSYTLTLAMKKINPDLILAGKQAIDGDTAQVGPGVAHFLDIPMLTYTKSVEVTDKGFKVDKVTEDGYEIWEIDKPAALTVVKEANELRMPSLKKKMAAKKAEIPVWGVEELQPEEANIGLSGSPTKVSKVFAPPVKLNKEILSGEPADMITELIKKLKEQSIL